MRLSLRSRSWMWTGRRIDRERSAMARVMPWRIHHVAYVENLNPRRQSNSSTARIRPMLPSWIRSSSGSPWPWYLRATDTTSRRLAMMKRWRAASALRTSRRALRDALLRAQTAGAEALLGLLAALDRHGELDLFLLGEQWLARRGLRYRRRSSASSVPRGRAGSGTSYHSPPRGRSVAVMQPSPVLGTSGPLVSLGWYKGRPGSGRAEKTPWQPLKLHGKGSPAAFVKLTICEGLVKSLVEQRVRAVRTTSVRSTSGLPGRSWRGS